MIIIKISSEYCRGFEGNDVEFYKGYESVDEWFNIVMGEEFEIDGEVDEKDRDEYGWKRYENEDGVFYDFEDEDEGGSISVR